MVTKSTMIDLKTVKDLNDNIGSTVFISGYTVQTERADRKRFTIFKDVKAAKTHFTYNAAENFKGISLLHGTLSKATSIPAEIDSCLDIFVLIPDATHNRDDVIVKCVDLDYLQQLVMMVTSDYGPVFNDAMEADFDKDNDLYEIDTHEIEDIYVLYGYEIELYFSFEEDSLDESLIEESEKLYKDIKDEQ
ncbi:hypothetical protein JZU46_04620 [bacterium]|nr:hypothetical protein [bacterium]